VGLAFQRLNCRVKNPAKNAFSGELFTLMQTSAPPMIKKIQKKKVSRKARKAANPPEADFQEVKKYPESIQARKVKKARNKDHYKHFERNVKLSQG